MCERIKDFDEQIEKRLDDTNFVNPEAGELYINEVEDENKVAHRDGTQTPDNDEYSDMNTEERPEQDDVDSETYDKYIVAEVRMDVPGEGPKRTTVKRRIENEDGSRARTYHRNPMMDKRKYELEYDDGTHDWYFANVIAENLYSQIDSEGHQFLVLEEILDHRKYGAAIEVADGFTIGANGNRHPKKKTRGWEMNMKMKEGFSKWVPLKDLKESNPVELAEYAVTNKIDHGPAFAWWLLFVLRERNCII